MKFKEYQEWLNESVGDKIVCPYCGEIDYNSMEEYEGGNESNCPNCGESYELKITRTISYTTKKKESYKQYINKKLEQEIEKQNNNFFKDI